MKLITTGGGTGGHIYPAVSIALTTMEEHPDEEVLFVGSSHGPEGEIVRKAGLDFAAVPSSPMCKCCSPKTAKALWKLFLGFFRARKILKNFGADAVVGTGGYTTAAVLLAARTLRKYVVIHEQNVVAGKTNIWLSRIANKVCVTFDESVKYFPEKKVVHSGMPVRKEFFRLPDKTESRLKYGLDPNKFTILVTGGSQGAKRLNELMSGAWSMIDDGNTQVLHQVGKKNIEEYRSAGSESYRYADYLDMPSALAACDMVVCRSGASSLSEIFAAGRASVLFPYPYAYADHQRFNAEFACRKGAAVMFDDFKCTPEMLAETVRGIRDDKERRESMALAAKSLSRPDAAHIVASLAYNRGK